MDIIGCQMACVAEGTPLHLSLLSLSEEENHEASLLRGADHQAHEPHPERAAAGEVRSGKLHCLGQQVCRRVLWFQKKEDH